MGAFGLLLLLIGSLGAYISWQHDGELDDKNIYSGFIAGIGIAFLAWDWFNITNLLTLFFILCVGAGIVIAIAEILRAMVKRRR